jgi:prepilin-type N-terminal cleavage/methylation domain-containing protein
MDTRSARSSRAFSGVEEESVSSRIAATPGHSLHDNRGFSFVELLVTMIVILAVLGTVTQIFIRSDKVYRQQRSHLDRRTSTTATVDMIVRLLRQAQNIATDPDGNGLLDSVAITADWNPRDGDTNDPYENIRFSVANGALVKLEPADAAPVAFADGITALNFAYFNPAGGAVLNPLVATQAQLAFVTVTVLAAPVEGQPGVVLSSSASIRRLE